MKLKALTSLAERPPCFGPLSLWIELRLGSLLVPGVPLLPLAELAALISCSGADLARGAGTGGCCSRMGGSSRPPGSGSDCVLSSCSCIKHYFYDELMIHHML